MSNFLNFLEFSGFSGFFPEISGISEVRPSGRVPGAKTDPTTPHMGSPGQSCPNGHVLLALCNIDAKSFDLWTKGSVYLKSISNAYK